MVAAIDQLHAVLHYRRNKDAYNTIQGRLATARRQFETGSDERQRTLLCRAFSWAVISIQTPVDVHEAAYSDLWDDADSPDEAVANLPEALSSVNYNNNKADYIRRFVGDTDSQDRIRHLLCEGRVDDAQKYIIDNVTGVSTVKAPFMLGNLGYTEKMCVDANVISLTDVDKPNTVVVDKYEATCRQICEMFPALDKVLSPYLLQWVIFCYKRNKDGRMDGVDMHDAWFDSINVT